MKEFEEFKDNVICRTTSSQFKADRQWGEIKNRFFPRKAQIYFEIERKRYLLNKFDADVMGYHIIKLEKEMMMCHVKGCKKTRDWRRGNHGNNCIFC